LDRCSRASLEILDLIAFIGIGWQRMKVSFVPREYDTWASAFVYDWFSRTATSTVPVFRGINDADPLISPLAA
jgi:hypothetical protein